MEVAQESQSKSSEMVHTQSTDQVHPLIKALVTKELDGILREMESLPQRLKTSLIGRLATRLLMIQKDDGLPQHHIMLVDPPPKPFRKMSKRELEEVFLCDVCRTAVHEAVDQMVLDMEWRQKSEMKSKRYKVAYASAVEEAHRQAIAALLLVDESEPQETEGVVGMLEDFLNPKTLFDRVRFSRNLRALSKTSVLKKNEPLTRSLLAVNNASSLRASQHSEEEACTEENTPIEGASPANDMVYVEENLSAPKTEQGVQLSWDDASGGWAHGCQLRYLGPEL